MKVARRGCGSRSEGAGTRSCPRAWAKSPCVNFENRGLSKELCRESML